VTTLLTKPKSIHVKSLFLVTALSSLAFVASAAPEPTTADTGKKVADVSGGGSAESSATPAEAEKPAKPMPMYRKVGTIDATTMTITYTTKKGVRIVEKVTDKTVIKQGDKPALFSEIKVGDMVSGLHLKTKENEYEVLKITKFGPAVPKEKAAGESKNEAEKN